MPGGLEVAGEVKTGTTAVPSDAEALTGSPSAVISTATSVLARAEVTSSTGPYPVVASWIARSTSSAGSGHPIASGEGL